MFPKESLHDAQVHLPWKYSLYNLLRKALMQKQQNLEKEVSFSFYLFHATGLFLYLSIYPFFFDVFKKSRKTSMTWNVLTNPVSTSIFWPDYLHWTFLHWTSHSILGLFDVLLNFSFFTILNDARSLLINMAYMSFLTSCRKA